MRGCSQACTCPNGGDFRENFCCALSQEACGKHCDSLGMPIAGVEAGHVCFCGHALANASNALPVHECRAKSCPGSASTHTEACGGSYVMLSFQAASMRNATVPHPPNPPKPLLPKGDSRWTESGHLIMSKDQVYYPPITTANITRHGYACQPYCFVYPDDGEWSCVMTFNNESWVEGTPGEHMISTRTKDNGATWSDFVPIEPFAQSSTHGSSSYGSIVGRPDGSRIFAVYVWNAFNISHLPGQNASASFRADMLGQFVWKYSDDRGDTWGNDHYVIPVPQKYIDRHNSWNGSVEIMWEVDHVKEVDGTVVFAFTKIGTYAVAAPEEIFFAKSENLLHAKRGEDVTWQVFPETDHGVEAVGGTTSSSLKGIAEEPHIVPLDAGGYYVVFRTSDGWLGSTHAISHEAARFNAGWANSSFAKYLAYAPWMAAAEGACWVKNPR